MLRPITRVSLKLTSQTKRLISTKGSKLQNLSAISNTNDSPATILTPRTHTSTNATSTTSASDFFRTAAQASMALDTFNRSHATAIRATTEKRDIMQLWSLLEACLQSNYMERAFSILGSLYLIDSHRRFFIDDYNLYLRRLSEIGTTHDLAAVLMKDLQGHFPDVQYNERTLAILIHHSLKNNQGTRVAAGQINTFIRMSLNGTREIYKNLDVLPLKDFEKLYFDYGVVSLNEVPESIRSMLRNLELQRSQESMDDVLPQEIETATETESAVTAATTVPLDAMTEMEAAPKQEHVSLDGEIQPLEKDVKELRAVNTIGMKVIRHALLGLSLNERQRESVKNFSFDADKNILNMDNNDKLLDFFEIFKTLKNDEERETFENILNDFNQDRQRALESRAADAARERWKHDFEDAKERGDISIQKRLNAKLWEWYNDMLPLVKEEIKKAEESIGAMTSSSSNKPPKCAAKKGSDSLSAPYLLLVNPEKMCVIAILELLKLNSTGGVIEGMRTARAVISVGKAIEMEFRSEQLLKSESNIFKEVNKKSPEFKKLVQRARQSFRSNQVEQSKIVWPQAIRAKIGSTLISTLIHVAKVDVKGFDPVTKQEVYGKAPAFSHGYQYCKGSKLGVIKIHRSLINQLNGERLIASVQPQLLPMLVKPRPWRNWRSGGYFYSQSTLIRSKESPEQLAYLKAVSDADVIPDVYTGLNALGETAWTINKKVFDVISQVWNTGDEFLEIPEIQHDMNLLPPPPRDSDPSEFRKWKLQNKELANKISKNRSVRCDTNYKLEIARAFLGEKFYFPHNLDFRGRAYPLSPHFNHLGNDLSRGLLIFWKGKKLGPHGLVWLKIHLSNLYGMDKAPFDERVRFVEDHLQEIKESAENPLTTGKWWKDADKPWQCLATCIELTEALKLDNPEEFISHQPVHQDGTCNGLQHYAALGGDVEGAEQVNLIPHDRPQDVYAHVARLVTKRLEKAALQGDAKAKILVDKISRKVVKQPVMTNVYGVTYVGATFQIEKQLSKFFPDRKECFDLSKYLTSHVFATIRELFHSAHLIQDWLGECANRITKSIRLDVDGKAFKNGDKPDFMSSVIWTTPLGLPIVQPYREASKKQVMTNLQTVFISDPFAVNGVNARRQKAGFPPNFIHSLDASHMLLSAIQCRANGLEFASVHDSYWTHACDIDKMSVYLREQFIDLHKVDLIERLKNEFDERYKNYVQIVKIDKNSDLGINVMNFRKKLSKKLGRPATLADEIQYERKRQELLNSESATDRETGSSMTTSVSLVENTENIEVLKAAKDSVSLLVIVPLRLPDIPPKGEFDVETVRSSKYFFS
ncbi:hypothetical protein NCAS_0C03720 [Naumovozyma castellii]|uniref:DNA-directed RNA polymerase n=1 Tax=Naumovozyma castellii TaxID=27288 RepID=G0VD01_NAUCA|nr:hypothetical protein NCAS_0C03720 [Naumovozyma castellii CBS 4309]CCC69362.1 hypothetical protein NCAS_0C03720 [Naumovozyma castellii CBS 4309]